MTLKIKMYKYPVANPSIGELEQKYVVEALKIGEISSQGGYIKKFEELFAKRHNASQGVACSSGMTALTLALSALGIKAGDEVIVPDFTMIATAWAIPTHKACFMVARSNDVGVLFQCNSDNIIYKPVNINPIPTTNGFVNNCSI